MRLAIDRRDDASTTDRHAGPTSDWGIAIQVGVQSLNGFTHSALSGASEQKKARLTEILREAADKLQVAITEGA